MFDNALRAYQDNDYDTALTLFRQASDAGNPDAAINIAVMLYNGYGCATDYAAAVKIWRENKGRRPAEAAYYLGRSYEEGRGVQRDYARARELYRRAKTRGFNPEKDLVKICGSLDSGSIEAEVFGLGPKVPARSILTSEEWCECAEARQGGGEHAPPAAAGCDMDGGPD